MAQNTTESAMDTLKFTAFVELATDPVTFRRILYPYKLFGRIYEITTLAQLLENEYPTCPFTRKPFSIYNIEKLSLFERQFFDVADNFAQATIKEKNSTKHEHILFLRKHGWNIEAAEMGDIDSMVAAALDLLSANRRAEAKIYATKTVRFGNLFGVDVLGHICMLEKDYANAHRHFVRCWSAPSWNLKGKTAYFIAECYFEQDNLKLASHWVQRSLVLYTGNEVFTLAAQIYYLQNRFNKCTEMAACAKDRNMLGAFIYAMCAYRKVGKFRKDPGSHSKGSRLMNELSAQGYIEAKNFLSGVPEFDAVRKAHRVFLRQSYLL
jgi:hypothetical protein